jgi:hypothetical protein
MVECAEAVAAGKRALKKNRFVKVTDADTNQPDNRVMVLSADAPNR